MRHARLFLCLAPVLLTTGCGELLSLHALYTRQNQTFDTSIEGRWENQDDRLLVERNEDQYDVTLQSKTQPSEIEKYEVHIVDIDGVRFADLLPEDHIGHMFLKVQVTGAELRISFFDTEWLRQRVPHEEADIENDRKQAVLTQATPQLLELAGKFSREPKAYDEEIVFRRAR